jgi:hypothetical protein
VAGGTGACGLTITTLLRVCRHSSRLALASIRAGSLGVDSGVARGGALLGVDHVHHAVMQGRQPGRGVGDQAGRLGVIDGGHDHAGAGPGTADRPGCWDWNQCAGRLPFHGGGDLLCLDAFRLAEHAVRGGEDRDACDDGA